MIDVEQEFAQLVASSARLVVEPATVRRRARRRQRRRRGIIVALVVSAPLAVLLAQRDDNGQPVELTDPGPTARQVGNEIHITFSDVPDGATGFHVGAHRFFVVRDGRSVEALIDDAQHLTSEYLWWCPVEEHFASPAHGETFDRDGRKIAGPGRRDLDRYETSISGDDLVVDVSRVRSGNPSTRSGTAPGEDPAYTRPWNSGPNSYCNGARTVDGPVPPRLPISLPDIVGGPEQVVIARHYGLSLLDVVSAVEIVVLDDVDVLPSIPPRSSVAYPLLARDGTVWFQVSSAHGDPPTIWRLDPAEPGSAELVATGTIPTVSPDARYLAYVEPPDYDDPTPSIVVVRDLTNGTERRWGGLPDDQYWPPRIFRLAWHPGGSRIAFDYSFGFESEERATRILDLADDETLVDALALPGRLMSPTWRSDGALLAVEYGAAFEERAPIVRFDDVNAEPTREAFFDGMDLYEIGFDASGDHLLARSGSDLYVVAPGGEARLIATEVRYASW